VYVRTVYLRMIRIITLTFRTTFTDIFTSSTEHQNDFKNYGCVWMCTWTVYKLFISDHNSNNNIARHHAQHNIRLKNLLVRDQINRRLCFRGYRRVRYFSIRILPQLHKNDRNRHIELGQQNFWLRYRDSRMGRRFDFLFGSRAPPTQCLPWKSITLSVDLRAAEYLTQPRPNTCGLT